MHLATRQCARIVRVVTTFIIVLTVIDIVGAYNAGTFEGDGAITDRGFWSFRPRYRVELRPNISLATPDRRQFRFRGLPPDPLSLFLVIQDSAGHEYEQLRVLSTSVDLTLSGHSGTEVCRAVGPLRDWKLMWSSGRDRAYWQRQCTELRLQSREWYTLTVAVSDVDSASPPVRVAPVLSGGGWDSP
jgi:hypothetical protein